MISFNIRNVQWALPCGLNYLTFYGERRNSRVGPVIVSREPVTTRYENPCERVLFLPSRDANPFFHLFEALWMMAGREDVKWLARFNSNMARYSDDGVVLNGAYGARWKNQIPVIAARLRENPEDRRSVVQLWSVDDLGSASKDVPCNTAIYFWRRSTGELDMTVTCRSNDIVWGAYGANAVHFSFLQEYLAAIIGCPVGSYWQISNNYHVYEDVLKKIVGKAKGEIFGCPYTDGSVRNFQIVNTDERTWNEDLAMFMEHGPIVGLRDRFFRRVAGPMWHAWNAWKENKGAKKIETPLEILQQCMAPDWRRACVEWIERRRPLHV